MQIQRRRAPERLSRALLSRIFPANSLFIREFGPEQSSILTAHTATQSSEHLKSPVGLAAARHLGRSCRPHARWHFARGWIGEEIVDRI